MASTAIPTASPTSAASLTQIRAHIPLTLDMNKMNYDSWRILFETHCFSFSLTGHIDGSFIPTGPTDTNWKQLENTVKMWIYGTISESLLNSVLKTQCSARELWLKLENLFRDNKEAQVIQLENELCTLTIGDLPVHDYCQKLKSISNTLANVDSPVSDRALVMHLLNGLTSKFDNIINVIKHRSPPCSFKDARSMLIDEESHLKTKRPSVPNNDDNASSSQVLLTMTPHRQSQPFVFPPTQDYNNNSYRGGHRNNRGNRGGRQVPQQRGAVYLTQTSQPHIQGPAPMNQAFIPTALPSAFNTMTLHDPTDSGWYMDTSATAHLTSQPGYPTNHSGYRCLDLQTKRIILSRHVIFDENSFPYQSSVSETCSSPSSHNIFTYPPLQSLSPALTHQPPTCSTAPRLTTIQPSPTPSTQPSPNPSTQPSTSVLPSSTVTTTTSSSQPTHSTHPSTFGQPSTVPTTTSSSQPVTLIRPSPSVQTLLMGTAAAHAPPPQPPHVIQTWSRSGISKKEQIFSLHTDTISPLPLSHVQAAKDKYWNNAMQDEYDAQIAAGTWTIVPRPLNTNIVRSMWLFRHKFNADGQLSRYKARLVANGKSQQIGIDCDETFSPVGKPASIRTVLQVAVSLDWPVHQLDVKNAFLYGDLDETVYMHQPPGFVDPTRPTHVCLLRKYLYGLKQAPRAWDNNGMFLSQQNYAVDIIHRTGMTNCNSTSTPVDTSSKLPAAVGTPVADPTLYRSLAGALQYLTFTRPDIAYAVQQVCLHMHDPREPHLNALKRIICYIKGTITHGDIGSGLTPQSYKQTVIKN
ncbi:PREDICTED: uncharacterized protein LOC104714976 [Camelina sativa]|uniref:Uncharacterized protein LOC104714976 n=1 Tax=Camelina sativa TaxID=90675 RepID=A0ABM0TST1_CAMSA|nr:PREDICTED: uncharacterized protein LOC104714976 [Camelina sativa]